MIRDEDSAMTWPMNESGDLSPRPAIDLLQEWLREDPGEQQRTWEYLRRALDEDRLSNRQLFPKASDPNPRP